MYIVWVTPVRVVSAAGATQAVHNACVQLCTDDAVTANLREPGMMACSTACYSVDNSSSCSEVAVTYDS